MSSGPSKVSKGRPPSDVWCNHMIQGNMQSRGHYSATCSYCRQYWRQGRPQVLSAHLANHCKKCPDDVSLYFAKIVGKNLAKEEEESADEDESDYPNKRVRQTGIKNFYGGGKIEKGRSDELDRALEPGYDPPSRRVLNGTLLEAELSRVNARVNNELEKESNFTIALDGWTDPRGNSLWAFILLTPSRKEYLLQLEDLSKNSHTAEYLSKVINDIICKVGISKIVAIISDNAANVAELRNSCISIFNKRYKEFDEDIYLLGFFLHPKYRGHGMRNNQFERLRSS
ncbi:unnamed protein product [Rhizophagus irregularis]|uniref:DUF659 domain-containing protein n=1 Tax=Rhizophagus irregularis TaxID=588596 RepID=A0A916E3K6_9GLOM|nr:unnamed protein product [Rhizophagus irregularis]